MTVWLTVRAASRSMSTLRCVRSAQRCRWKSRCAFARASVLANATVEANSSYRGGCTRWSPSPLDARTNVRSRAVIVMCTRPAPPSPSSTPAPSVATRRNPRLIEDATLSSRAAHAASVAHSASPGTICARVPPDSRSASSAGSLRLRSAHAIPASFTAIHVPPVEQSVGARKRRCTPCSATSPSARCGVSSRLNARTNSPAAGTMIESVHMLASGARRWRALPARAPTSGRAGCPCSSPAPT